MAELSKESFSESQIPQRGRVTSGTSKHSRGRNGCLNCRRRRKKCDERKPTCTNCTTRGESCEWDTKVIFRLSGIGTSHPSMVQSRNMKSNKDYQITNVTFDGVAASSKPVYQESQHTMSMDSSSSHEQSVWDTLEPQSSHNFTISESGPIANPTSRAFDINSNSGNLQTASFPGKRLNTQGSDISSPQAIHDSISPKSSTNHVKDHGKSQLGERQVNFSNFPTPVSRGFSDVATTSIEMPDVTNTSLPENSVFGPLDPFTNGGSAQSQLQIDSSKLEALDYLTSQPHNLDFLASDGSYRPRNNSEAMYSSDSPDLHSNYYPDATYRDLHTTLYCHMVETARNTALTRQASPEPAAQGNNSFVVPSSSAPMDIEQVREQTRDPFIRLQPLKSTKLTQRRQLELWRNYLDEIAGWLDMFDSERHFQFKIPLLAKSADHLHYSILALSARQLERKSCGQLYTESLGLYQEAIQLIVRELYTLDTTVIASCVLLCVLEMMSSSPKAWCRHLDGCAMLLQAAGVNGVVGGVRQSLFWCFARMDVWGGFLEDTLTKIPTSRWFFPSGSMIDAVTHFKTGSGSHSYANYAVFLCASVVNVISNKSGSSTDRFDTNSSQKTTYSVRWKALFDC
ncbi:hypothetical protein BKA64DRAFT_261659 [Cadophora sp. MPI-SDFR-AT-0126]|nr:hypothetical protein BKA64DRAFT_261659 [Leotiomycetes sp. MPI-SDFR-AT-0126]